DQHLEGIIDLMRHADGDFAEGCQLIAPSYFTDVFGETDGAHLIAIIVIDNGSRNGHRNRIASSGFESRFKITQPASRLDITTTHRGHHPTRLFDAGIDYQKVFSQHFLWRKTQILPRPVVVKRNNALLVHRDDDVGTTLDELLKVLYR